MMSFTHEKHHLVLPETERLQKRDANKPRGRILCAASRFIPECDLDHSPKVKVISALLDAVDELRKLGLEARPFHVLTSRGGIQRFFDPWRITRFFCR